MRRVAPLASAAVLLLLAQPLTAASAPADSLLSQGRPVTTSSAEEPTLAGQFAVDGRTDTRWASAPGIDPQWLAVDLGSTSEVHQVIVRWEAAYATKYKVQISANGSAWTDISSRSTGDGDSDTHAGLQSSGRYLRVLGTARATSYGYSIWELEVYGVRGGGDTVAPSIPGGLRVTGTTASSASLAWTAATDNVGVTGYDVLRDGVVVGTANGTTYTDGGLAASTGYDYAVRARDAAGNTSAVGNQVRATTGAGSGSFVIAAAGDIAEQCTASSSSCVHPKTAKLVEQLNPLAVITMGDNQYDDAHLSDFQNYYDKTWGKFKAKTKPVPGNHETYDSPPLAGYKGYFGAIATPQGKTYYSWDQGNWHFVALDSNESSKPGSAQIEWLKQDLANNRKGCVAAYFHHPRWSSGEHGNNTSSAGLWDTLVANKADLVLAGHDHHYERFKPLNAAGKADPNGTRSVIGGGGGASLYKVSANPAVTEFAKSTHGVLKMTLTDSTYSWQYLGLDGKPVDSTPTYNCH
ncbi:discoidin domain-containing protein [Actinosynnema sp. NPDC047251]|uniref:Alkaline phosphatase n=1 Tax=Saccharothrix espanaensis (strain ATCC 51144 / DSM 44229 / JCM 9112 / NBRC 15066 / NRRL 15764) TaxID=1179773 RepID=K0K2P1_SACES|nr:discoidin domain-containing protein [Saccharothrix espanaensis]CCH34515.1 Alkaline phosphatase [Saccharothrix espanaensis DSM 44229]